MEKGLIIGKGWIGSKLETFLKDSFELTTTKRKSDTSNCLSIDFDSDIIQHINTSSFAFIVITIPFGKRNTINDLKYRFNHLIQTIEDFKGQLILISSTGIYPTSEEIITEDSFQDTELNEPYISIENQIQAQFPQTTILRLGGIMGDDRYLSKYLNLNREGLDEVVNHVHYQDILAVIKSCIENHTTSTIYNVVAPEHPTKREVLEYQIKRLSVAADIKKGKTISSEKLINELDYQFIHSDPIYFKSN